MSYDKITQAEETVISTFSGSVSIDSETLKRTKNPDGILEIEDPELQLELKAVLAAAPVQAALHPSASKIDGGKYLDAFSVQGDPLFDVGTEIIIERYIKLSGPPQFFDTRCYRVVHIEYESGDVKLFDTEMRQSAFTNYKRAPKEHGDIIKIIPKKKKK